MHGFTCTYTPRKNKFWTGILFLIQGVDLLITETFDAGLFGEHVLEILDHAWNHLLHQVILKASHFWAISVLYWALLYIPQMKSSKTIDEWWFIWFALSCWCNNLLYNSRQETILVNSWDHGKQGGALRTINCIWMVETRWMFTNCLIFEWWCLNGIQNDIRNVRT